MEPRHGLEPFQDQDSSPFKGELTPILPYEHMTINYIMELVALPDKVVRVSLRNNKNAENTRYQADYLVGQLGESDKLLEELTDKYGINVVPHKHILAGSPDDPKRVTAYTVADRVLGESFRTEIEKKPPNVTQIDVESLYRGLTAYHLNILKDGGTYLSDITRNNAQYMYGHTSSDLMPRIYLIDIDPMMRTYTIDNPTSAQSRDLHRSIGALAGCITKAEEVSGWDLSLLKAEYLQSLDVVPPESEFRHYIDDLRASKEK